ncbi:uncharacterized protein LOC131883893 [Tigriopus californicus]|uniref:uncharacterized protein LOC131883893 n=1 Tax=Tigriopus californicus TaxID=6832 RepID=UPI0027DA55CA|nr:uncharacterized protein LOC131883893 [Tigriopus californicus]
MSRQPYPRSFSRPPYTIPNRNHHSSRALEPQRSQEDLDLEQLELSLGALDIEDAKNLFTVEIKKNSLGFGFSIKGGSLSGSGGSADTSQYIRIRKIFPLQPAWQTGQLRVGDILIKAGDICLCGLNLRQALDILRTSPNVSVLTVCRPFMSQTTESVIDRCSVVRSYSDSTSNHRGLDVPMIVSSNQNATTEEDTEDTSSIEEEMHELNANYLLPKDPSSPHFIGQFIITLGKVKGSLGFTLHKANDDDSDYSVMRHTIKGVTKEPALSDGRIKPGDKLIAANGQDCDDLCHDELIHYLRSCTNQVSLKLYRDASRSQTPLSPEGGGPTPARSKSFDHPARHKELRFEAKEMVRSLQASRSSLEKLGSEYGGSTNSLGRGLKPHGKHLNNHLSHFKDRHHRCRTTSECTEESIPVIESPISPVKEFPNSLPPLHLPEESYIVMEDLLDNEAHDFDEIDGSPEVEFPRVPTYESDLVEYVAESELIFVQECPHPHHEPSPVRHRPTQLGLTSSTSLSYSFTYQPGSK